jgi:hypothetical protein
MYKTAYDQNWGAGIDIFSFNHTGIRNPWGAGYVYKRNIDCCSGLSCTNERVFNPRLKTRIHFIFFMDMHFTGYGSLEIAAHP